MKSGIPTGRLAELDGLRAIGMASVVLFHYFYLFVPKPLSAPWSYLLEPFNPTWNRVSLLFVLSGFLIGNILLEHRNAPNFFQTFYIRRLCRILPLYYLFVFLYYVLVALGAENWSPLIFGKPLPTWSYLTFTQSFVSIFSRQTEFAYWFGAMWTLNLEQQFYLVAPLFIRFMSPRVLVWASFILFVAAIIFRLWIFLVIPLGPNLTNLLLPSRLDTFMAGIWAALLLRSEKWRNRLTNASRPLTFCFLILAGGVAIFRYASPDLRSFLWQSIGYTWVALTYMAVLILAVTIPMGPVRRFLRHPFLARLATISYGMYIIHFPLLGLAHVWAFGTIPRVSTLAEVGVTLGALAVTILLAILSWHYIEKPFIDLGHHFTYASPASSKVAAESVPEKA
jgi:peptidoglycan/LPS O-acetylase OafA/YrhL